jgi:oligoribonuclease NrnB/cAMP/cGMP phosphodiesterase (DHH superfamily)
MTTHIIHHNDLDGYASAGIAKAFLIRDGIQPVFYEMNYGMTLPDVFGPEDTVYVLDFSLQPFDMGMDAIANRVAKFIWIDHHASSIRAYELLQKEKGIGWGYEGVRLDGVCGAELTWAWFNLPGKALADIRELCATAPQAIKLVGDWDTWRHAKMVDSQAPFFKIAFDTFPPEGIIDWFEHYTTKTLDHWEMSAAILDKLNQGVSIKLYEIQESEALMKSRAMNAKLIVPFGTPTKGNSVYSAIAANFGSRGSDRFRSVYDPEKHEIMVGFAYENTGKVTVSLYSTNPDIDCGDIAKRCGEAGPFPGGGGHKGEAGFQTSWEFLMHALLVLQTEGA